MNVGAAIAASQRTTTGAPPMTRETDIGPVGAAHVPVMVAEVVEWLRPRPGTFLVDGTIGLLQAAVDPFLTSAALLALTFALTRDDRRWLLAG